MTDKLSDEEFNGLKGLTKPYGAGGLSDEIRASLQAKGLIKITGPGVLARTAAGDEAVRKK